MTFPTVWDDSRDLDVGGLLFDLEWVFRPCFGGRDTHPRGEVTGERLFPVVWEPFPPPLSDSCLGDDL